MSESNKSKRWMKGQISLKDIKMNQWMKNYSGWISVLMKSLSE